MITPSPSFFRLKSEIDMIHMAGCGVFEVCVVYIYMVMGADYVKE